MSKYVSAYQYRRAGKLGCIKYHTKNCKAMTGKIPMAIKAEGKKRNLPAKICKSAKEVLRRIQPEKACCMSFADNLVEQGHNDEKVFNVARQAERVFKGLIELGVSPLELKA